MASFRNSSARNRFGLGSNIYNRQNGVEATYYQNQTGFMDMNNNNNNNNNNNSQNYNSINIDPHELATRAAKNATMAAAALPEASRQFSGNFANQQGLSARTLQNVLDRQYDGFLQVAAKIAQIHEKADELRTRYLHMTTEERAYATGGVQNAGRGMNTFVGGSNNNNNARGAYGGMMGNIRSNDPFRDADEKEKQLKANEARRVNREKIKQQPKIVPGMQQGGGGGLGGGGLNSLGGGAALGGTTTTQFGSTTNTTGGGLFGSATNTTVGGGLFGGGTKTAATNGGGLFGGGTKPAATGGGGMFGATTTTGGNTGGGLFGGATTTTTTTTTGGNTGGLFGGANNNTGLKKSKSLNTGGGLFGASNTANTGGGLFGGK